MLLVDQLRYRQQSIVLFEFTAFPKADTHLLTLASQFREFVRQLTPWRE